MKTIEQILDNYTNYETSLEDRLGSRLCAFLTLEQVESLGFKFTDEDYQHEVKPFTKENILVQLKEDVEFGWKKAINERGISSNLMFEVVRAWNKILENELAEWSEDDYRSYGLPLFMATAKLYGWELG